MTEKEIDELEAWAAKFSGMLSTKDTARLFAEVRRLREALEVIAGGDGDADVIARQTLDHTES